MLDSFQHATAMNGMDRDDAVIDPEATLRQQNFSSLACNQNSQRLRLPFLDSFHHAFARIAQNPCNAVGH